MAFNKVALTIAFHIRIKRQALRHMLKARNIPSDLLFGWRCTIFCRTRIKQCHFIRFCRKLPETVNIGAYGARIG